MWVCDQTEHVQVFFSSAAVVSLHLLLAKGEMGLYLIAGCNEGSPQTTHSLSSSPGDEMESTEQEPPHSPS